MVDPTREGAAVEGLIETLSGRVDGLIESHKSQKLLSTTGTRTSIDELARRLEGLEQALREVTLEVQRLAASAED